MPVHRLSEMTWVQVRDLDRGQLIAILPVGAVEAHGPHLPISTDPIIASAMAEDGAHRLAAKGYEALVLPTVEYTAASFAAGFPGTVSVRKETVVALVDDIAAALVDQGVRHLVIANSHFDPTHLAALYEAVERIRERDDLTVAFPDVTRRPWATRLGEEFLSGACHAGRYEGSIVLARRPDLVHEATRRELAANPNSLSTAIRAGLATFEEAGGPEAYFGDPAAATAAEGEETISVLGGILEEAVLALIRP